MRLKRSQTMMRGELLCQVGFFEEILDLLGIVVIIVATDPLNLSDISSCCRSLDVFEYNFWIFTQVYNAPKIVIESFCSSAISRGGQ